MIQKQTFKNREEWEAWRTSSNVMGSSDVGTILGLNPYQTPYQYWLKKKSPGTAQISNEINLLRGLATEGATMEIFCHLTGEKVIQRSAEIEVYTNTELAPFVQCAPDRELFAKEARSYRAFCEVKDTKLRITQEDMDYPMQTDYRVLQMWYCQGLFRDHVSGRAGGYLVINNGAKEVIYKFYEYNPEVAQSVYDYCVEWWEKYIIGNDIPAMETGDDVILAFPVPETGKVLNVSPEIRDLFAELKELKKKAKESEKGIKSLEDQLKVCITDSEVVSYEDKYLATWRAHEVGRIDIDRLRTELPEIAEKYTIKTMQRKFLLK